MIKLSKQDFLKRCEISHDDDFIIMPEHEQINQRIKESEEQSYLIKFAGTDSNQTVSCCSSLEARNFLDFLERLKQNKVKYDENYKRFVSSA